MIQATFVMRITINTAPIGQVIITRLVIVLLSSLNLLTLTNSLAFDLTHLAADGTLQVVSTEGAPVFPVPISPSFIKAFPGDTVSMSGFAVGAEPITYLWQCNGRYILNRSTTLTLSNLVYSQSGEYTLVAINSYGRATNPFPATLVVSPLVMDSTLASSGLCVSWDSSASYLYQMRATEDFRTWTNFGAPVLGTGAEIVQVIPTTNHAAWFVSIGQLSNSIDPSRMPAERWKDTQWIDPGGWTTIDVSTLGLTPDNPSLDAAVQLQSILQKTSGRRRLYFPKGTYYFRTTITITASDIWIDGEGRDKTFFTIDALGSVNAEIRFAGSISSGIAVLGSPAPGDATLTVADASGLVVGDLIQLYADNAPLTNTGQAWSLQTYAQIFKIVAKSGNALSLDMKVLLNYDSAYIPVVRKLKMIRNIKFEDVRINRVNEPTVEDVSNLEFVCAFNCWVMNIESSFSGRTHIGFENSKDCVITDNYVHDCWKHTTGGYGYGYNLVATTGCRITNNKSSRLRHHIIISIGANHNVASYNSIENPYDYNDVALHSVFAYMNLFEGNMFKEGYADASKDGWTTVEPTTGPGNTWFRNFATGRVGCIQSATTKQNVFANVVGSLATSGSQHYIGANRVAGIENWGVFGAGTVFPASLYLTSKPDFFGDVAWPVFGPGIANWGATNLIPARIRLQ